MKKFNTEIFIKVTLVGAFIGAAVYIIHKFI